MDIFEILRIEHASIRDLLDQLIDATSTEGDLETSGDLGRDWPDLLNDLKLTLVAHNRAEEAVFYDILRQIPHRNELADIKIEEHHMAEELLEDLEEIDPADYEWPTKLALLKNQIESHVAEEETMVFGVVQPSVTDEEAERMVHDFETLRDEIIDGAKYHPKGRSILNPAGLDLES